MSAYEEVNCTDSSSIYKIILTQSNSLSQPWSRTCERYCVYCGEIPGWKLIWQVTFWHGHVWCIDFIVAQFEAMKVTQKACEVAVCAYAFRGQDRLCFNTSVLSDDFQVGYLKLLALYPGPYETGSYCWPQPRQSHPKSYNRGMDWVLQSSWSKADVPFRMHRSKTLE